jgi:Rho GDP-dissociation inhibitor|eukprot:gene1651-1203_t
MSAPPPKPPRPEVFQGTPTAAATAETTGVAPRTTDDLADILSKDTEDESLRKYKESLLGSAAHGDRGDTSDPRRLVIEEFRVVFAPDENLPDIVHNLSTQAGLDNLRATGITMKEGAKFKFRITFRVQHDLIAGVKFVNSMTRMMMTEAEDLMLGSYPPSSTPHVFEFPKWDFSEAPKGMMYRGKYRVVNSFIDSDRNNHLNFEYDFTIVK